MNTIEIFRKTDNRSQTLGEAQVVSLTGEILFQFRTLELPWRNNQRRVSCIPPGTYPLIKHTSPKFGLCYWVQDVPNRSEILIHKGNYHTDILGCILPGKDFVDINGDGQLDVTSSGDTMRELLTFNCTKLVVF